MGYLTEFGQFMSQYADFLEQMAEEEKEKLGAFSAGNIHEMEHSISIQQAYEKKMQNFEYTRQQIQDRMGTPDKTFRQIIDSAPQIDKEALEEVFKRLEDAVAQVKFYNTKTMGIIQAGLRQMEGMGSQQPEAVGGYTAQKKKNDEKAGGGSLFSAKI